MFGRIHPAWLAFGGSVLLFAGLVAALRWDPFAPQAPTDKEPLTVYCAEALRVPMEATARAYEQEAGQKVFLHFGPSQTILTSLALTTQGDLFLPADDSFIDVARKKDLVSTVVPLARMTAVAIVRPGFDRPIRTWAEFIAPGHTLGVGNTGSTAIGKLLRERLTGLGLWRAVEKCEPKYLISVNDVANSVALGSVDVGVVWDAVAWQHPKLTAVHLPELDRVTATVQIALTRCSTQPDAAMAFTRFVRAKDKGARYFKQQGYTDFSEDEAAGGRELVVYAGAMLRPAVEKTIAEFEQREGAHVTRVYNGCGILVSQMKTGDQPDLYFACDARFMEMVQHRFEPATAVSSNQLVIAVRKGNPHAITRLADLGKPGLRVGVGHEQQCALGALTREAFRQKGLYGGVRRNIVLQSPTGDFLINQLRSGANAKSPALDAAVVYRSNVTPFADELEAVPVTGIPCATPQQPLAVSKTTAHRELAERLKEALQSAESKARFEHLGFGWQPAARPAE